MTEDEALQPLNQKVRSLSLPEPTMIVVKYLNGLEVRLRVREIHVEGSPVQKATGVLTDSREFCFEVA